MKSNQENWNTPQKPKLEKVSKIIEILLNITPKKIDNIIDYKSEIRELLEQVNLSERLLDSIPESVFAKDLEWNFLTCNKAFLKFMWLEKKDDVYFKKWVCFFSKKDCDFFNLKNQEFLHSWKENEEFEYTLEDWRHLLIKYSRLESLDWVLKWIMWSVSDISMIQRRMKIVEWNNSVLKHEIWTPLNWINCAATMLELNNLDPEQWEYINILKNSVKTLIWIVEKSRILVRLEMWTYKLDYSKFDLWEILKECELFNLNNLEKNCNIIYIIDWNFIEKPKIDIFWDKDLIRLMYFNLIKNAIEASWDVWGIIVNISNEDKLKISIKNWWNIPENIRDKFWDKYVTEWKEKWTWFWTYIIKQIVDIHWWTIDFETGNWTTTIILKLPNKEPL